MFKLIKRFKSHQDIQKVAMSALEEYKNFIFEVDSINTWLSRVMKNPHPIILQAYADWSLHSQKLNPILEKRAMKDEGKWLYCRFNIDEMTELSNALEIMRVPTLFLINKGNVMNKLEGNLTESELDDIIGDAKLIAGLLSDETVYQGLLQAGEDFIKEKKYNEAIKTFKEALGNKEFGEKYNTQCLEGMLCSYFGMGEFSKARECLDMIEGKGIKTEKILEIKEKLMENIGKQKSVNEKIEKIKENIRNDLGNFSHLAELAWVFHENGKSEEGIEVALDLIEKEKSFKGFGQKVIVRILNELGNDHLLTKPARKRMQSLFIKYS